MEIIVSKILEILKSNSDMVNKEKIIGLVLNNLYEAIMTETFQRLDKELKPIYVAKGWKRLRSDEREIQGFFGCLTVRRSLFKDLSGVAHYPLTVLFTPLSNGKIFLGKIERKLQVCS